MGRDEQYLNALSPTDVIDEGIVIFANKTHPSKTDFGREVIDKGSAISIKDLQSLKALSPINLVDDGIIKCSSDAHSQNALFPIDVINDGIRI